MILRAAIILAAVIVIFWLLGGLMRDRTRR
jgi:hypothetical protein